MGNKLIDEFEYEFGVGTYIPVTPSCTRVLKSGKTQTRTQTQSRRGKPIKWVWFGWVPAGMGFVAMPKNEDLNYIQMRK